MTRQEFRWDLTLIEESPLSGIVIFQTPEGKGVLASSSVPEKSFLGIYEVQKQNCSTKANSNISVIFGGEARCLGVAPMGAGKYIGYDAQGRVIEVSNKTKAIGKTLEKSRFDNTVKINLWGE